MAMSKEQLEQVKFLYNLEEERAKSLTGTGNIYITLIGVFVGYLGYKATDTQFSKLINFSWCGWRVGLFLYGLVFACLLASLAATLLSVFMHEYRRPGDLNAYIDETLPAADDPAAFIVLAVYLGQAWGRNDEINKQRAGQLTFASYLLFAAVVLYAAAFLLMISRPPPIEPVL